MPKPLLALACLLVPQLLFAVASPWLGSEQIEDKAYFLHAAAARIEVFDLDSEQWLASLPLAKAPSCFESDEKYLYIAYGKTVYRYQHDLTEETHVGNFANNVRSLHVDGEILIVNDSPYQASFASFNRETRAPIDTFTISNSGFASSKVQMQSESNQILAPYNYYSLQALTYDNNGTFSDTININPLPSGSYISDEFFVWPNKAKIVTDDGFIYASQNLELINSFFSDVRSIAFLEDTLPIVADDNLISSYSKAYRRTGEIEIDVPIDDLIIHGENVLGFYIDPNSGNGMGVRTFTFEDLKLDDPSLPIDPSKFRFEPDATFVDQDGILYLVNKTFELIFRWDTSTQTWLENIQLRNAPSVVEYSIFDNQIYVGYPTGGITKIDPAADTPTEVDFIDTNDEIALIVPAGDYLFIDRQNESGRTFYTYSLAGAAIASQVHGSDNNHAVWNTNLQRVVYNSADSPSRIYSGGINPDGTLSDYTNTTLVSNTTQSPLRSHPSEPLVLTASGRLVNPEAETTIATLTDEVEGATWINNSLYSLHQDSIKTWSLPTYEENQSLEILSTPLSLQSTPDDKLVLVSQLMNGLLRISILNTDFTTVPPASLAAPELDIYRTGLNTIQLAWHGSDGAETYQLERSQGESGEWTQIAETSYNELQYSDYGYDLGQTYSYRIRAKSGDTLSEYSNTIKNSTTLEHITLVDRVPSSDTNQLFKSFVDDDDILYLTYHTEPYLFRYDLVDQTWMQAIPLQAMPSAMTYSKESGIIYMGYYNRPITQISIANASPSIEYPFTTQPNSPSNMVAGSDTLVVFENYNHTAYDLTGIPIANTSLGYVNNLETPYWNEETGNYFASQYSQISEFQIKRDNFSIGQISYAYSNSGELRAVDPSGSLFLTHEGKLYSSSLGDALNELGTNVSYGLWVDSQLYTTNNKTLSAWTLPTYSEGQTHEFDYTIRELEKTSEGNLVLVAGDGANPPLIEILNSDFEIVPPDTLSAPANLSLLSPTTDRLAFTWADVGGEAGYAIERRATGEDWAQIDTTAANVTTYSDLTASSGVGYIYRVKAINGDSSSDYSQTFVIGAGPAGTVSNLQASYDEATGITLSWDLAENAYRYRVQRRTGTGYWYNLSFLEANETQYLDPNIYNDALHHYRIQSFGPFALIVESDPISIGINLSKPTKPYNLGAYNGGLNTINLSWNSDDSTSQLRLERSLTSNPNVWTEVAELPFEPNAYIDTGLTHSTEYLYRITAINEKGESSPANFPAVSTETLTEPNSPFLYGGIASQTSIHLNWLQSPKAASYRLLRKEFEATEWQTLATLTKDEQTFLDEGLSQDKGYIYGVVALNEIGDSPLSNELVIIPDRLTNVLADDFENGIISDNYSSIDGAIKSDDTPSIGDFFDFEQPYRTIFTKSLNLSQGAVISFDLKFIGNSEYASSHQFEVNYYTSQWSRTMLTASASALNTVDNWRRITLTLPRNGWSDDVAIRFISTGYGSNQESWGIDNLSIDALAVTPPSPPLTVVAKAAPDGGVSVFWSHSFNADTYLLEQSQDLGETWIYSTELDNSRHYYHDPSPYNEASLYRVSAVNIGGKSAPTLSNAEASSIELFDAVQSGVDKVLANPNAYGLYLEQNLEEARVIGHQEVRAQPGLYGLFESETYSHVYFKVGAQAINIKGDLLTTAWILYRSSNLQDWTEHPFHFEVILDEPEASQFIKVAPQPADE